MTNNTERKALIKLAEDAGFVLNPIGQLVVPAPHDDATPYLDRFLKAALAQREQKAPSLCTAEEAEELACELGYGSGGGFVLSDDELAAIINAYVTR